MKQPLSFPLDSIVALLNCESISFGPTCQPYKQIHKYIIDNLDNQVHICIVRVIFLNIIGVVLSFMFVVFNLSCNLSL